MTVPCPLLDAGAEPLQGLPPVVAPGASLLVLGSMPGGESLRRGEYYAHPRNAFWPIVEECLGIPRAWPYPERLEALGRAGVALWDVLGACIRHGSLDTGIERASMRTNDIPGLLRAHPGITGILFNGIFAQTVFRSRIAARGGLPGPLVMTRLPSTSPANASRSHADKLAEWKRALGGRR